MTQEIETIGLGMDTSGVEKGIKALDVLAGKGAPVEKAMAGIEGASERTGKSLKALGDSAGKGLGDVAQKAPAAADGLKKVDASADKAEKSMRSLGGAGASGLDALGKAAASTSAGMRTVGTASAAADKGIRGMATAANEVTTALRAEAAALTGLQAGFGAVSSANSAAAKSMEEFRRSVAASTAAVESLVAKANALDRLDQAGGKAATGVRGLKTASDGATQSMLGLASAGATAFIGSALVRGVVETTKAIYEASAAAQRFQTTLDFASGGRGAQEIAYLREVTKELGLQFGTTAQAYAGFQAAAKGTALEGQKARAVFESIAKASAVMGLSADQTSGVLLALQQMISKGTVQAEELRGQLGERLPGAFQVAAKAMGVTTAELGKMLERGEVVANDFLPKFAKALEENLGGASEKAATRLDASANRVTTAFERIKQNAGDSGISKFVAGQYEILADGFDGVSTSMEKARAQGSGFFGQLAAGSAAVLKFVNPLQAFSYSAVETGNALKQAEEEMKKLQASGAKDSPNFYLRNSYYQLQEYIKELKRAKEEQDKLTGSAPKDPRDQSGFPTRTQSINTENERLAGVRASVAKILGTQSGIKDNYQKDLAALYQGYQDGIFSKDATKNLEAYRKAVVQLIKDSATAKPDAGANAALSDSLNAQVQLYKNRDQAILDGRKAFNDQLDLMVKLGAKSELDALQETLDKENEVWKARKANFEEELAAAAKKKNSQAEQQRIQGQVLDAERDHQQALAKLGAESRLLDQKSLDAIDSRASKEQAAARSVQEQVRLARLETQAIGKTGDALGALNQARTEEIAKQLEARAATEDGIDLSGRTSKALRDQAQATRELAQVSGYNDAKKSLDDYNRSINETTEGLRLELSLMGESETVRATAIEQFKIELRLRKQIEDIKSRTKKDSPEQKELIDEAVGIADKDKVNASQKVVLDEWKKTTDSINQSLTDALLRGFESGKGFAENFRDTLKNMINTLVLRPIISAALSPISGAISGVVNGIVGGGGGGGGLLNLASNASSIYNGASTVGSIFSGAQGLGTLSSFSAGYSGAVLPASMVGPSIQAPTVLSNLGYLSNTGTLAGGGSAAGGAGASSMGAWGAGGVAALIMLGVINALGGMRSESMVGSGLAGTLGNGTALTPWQEWREGGTLFDGSSFSTHNPLEELALRRRQLQELRDNGQGESNYAVGLQAIVTDLEKTTKGLAEQTAVFDREINKGYKTYRDNVVKMADSLGLAGSSIEDFAYTLGAQDLNLQGLKPEEVQAKIQEVFGKAGDAMAKEVLGSWREVTDTVVNTYVAEQMTQANDGRFVTETTTSTRMEYVASVYAKTGETAIQTLERLSTSFNALNETADALGFGIQQGSLALADFSDKFIEAFGGLEKFSSTTSAYMQAYYSDEERRQALLRSGARQANRLGLDGVTAASLEQLGRDGIRAFVTGLIEGGGSAEEIRDAMDLANFLSPAFESLDAQTPVVQELSNVVDELTQAYQNAVKSLKGDADSLAVELLRAQGKETEAKALERSQYLAQFAGLDEARRKEIETLYDGNMATRAYIQGIKDAAQAQLDALDKLRASSLEQIDTAAGKTDAAMAAYERAADKERERLQGVIDDVRGVFEAAKEGARSLFDEVDAVVKFQGAEGRDFISRALAQVQAGGALPDGKDLSEAISAVGKDFASTQYASQAEADFQRLVVANELKGLQDVSGDQLTEAERQLKELEDQTRWAREQVDALRGIDSSIKTLPEAIAGLIKAYNNEAQIRANVGAKAIIGSGSAVYDKTTGTGKTSSGAYFDASDMAEIARDVIAANGDAGKASVLDALQGQGFTMAQYDQMFGLPAGTLEAEARALGKPIYHSGTTYVPETGFALLQQGEAVIPAAYNPWANGAMGGGGDSAVVSELRLLRDDNRAQAGQIIRLQAQVAKLLNQWNVDGIPEERELTL